MYDKIKLVSWDVDGTLYSVKDLYWQLFRQYCSSIATKDWQTAHSELNTIKAFHKKFKKISNVITTDAFAGLDRPHVRDLEKKWFGNALKNVPVRKEALFWLKHFEKKGIQQVTLSNFECDYKIQSLGLDSFFKKHWSCEFMNELKPSAQPFYSLRKFDNIQDHEHLHIGDRPDMDGKGAKNSGCLYLQLPS